ncbi:hypothetical protein T440DRAFT_508131 [Plenodomus tracheiphilus IPT5]|uniref:Protein kinase domain-containing protein n=1 Tax=Plenodomus tracheiphilus IPT5 TaxID=1408161 RepID=A0A6A7B4S7_9PLEO|nr:hypothetical protein T440DRAFT_508131 [Plenodomus tracheiphilus IPT5]
MQSLEADRVDACVELTNLIRTTLIFIRDVTKGRADCNESTIVLDHTLSFLDTFVDLCFDETGGILRDVRVHQRLTRDVEEICFTLNKSLASHREAWRYIGRTSTPSTEGTAPEVGSRQRAASLGPQHDRRKWRDEIKERSQLWRERAQPRVSDVLFGPDEMQTLVSSCLTSISCLRQTLEITCLVLGPPTADYWTSTQAATLGIKTALERQYRAGATPSSSYKALPGRIRESINDMQPPVSLIKTVYTDGTEEVDVLVEPRLDADTPIEFMCHLTWLLQAPAQPTVVSNLHNHHTYELSALPCIGFIDDPANTRTLILYRSPQSSPWASSPPSLHDLISKGDYAKLSLGRRFLAARTLAATLLEAHSSGWIHGNVQSRSIVMLPHDLNDTELSPSFVGWGVLQAAEATYYLLEPNLYRHHNRFGRASSECTSGHDIYSLGVVLLEIGIWKTMAKLFERRLEKSPRFDFTQQESLSSRIHNATLDWARSIEIERAMGKKYAQVVLRCLTWHQKDSVEGLIEFRKQVVDALTAGSRI